MNRLTYPFWRTWPLPVFGCVIGFILGFTLTGSIMLMRKLAVLHATQSVYDHIRRVEDRLSILGEIAMRLIDYDPPYPDTNTVWQRPVFIIVTNAVSLALFGYVVGWIWQKQNRVSAQGKPPMAQQVDGPGTAFRRGGKAMAKAAAIGGGIGFVFTVGVYLLLRLTITGDSFLTWMVSYGAVLLEPARYLAERLGWSLDSYDFSMRVLCLALLINTAACASLGIAAGLLLKPLYRTLRYDEHKNEAP